MASLKSVSLEHQKPYLNLDPSLKNPCFCLVAFPGGAFSLKKVWYSTAHFHKYLQLLSLRNLATKCLKNYATKILATIQSGFANIAKRMASYSNFWVT